MWLTTAKPPFLQCDWLQPSHHFYNVTDYSQATISTMWLTTAKPPFLQCDWLQPSHHFYNVTDYSQATISTMWLTTAKLPFLQCDWLQPSHHFYNVTDYSQATISTMWLTTAKPPFLKCDWLQPSHHFYNVTDYSQATISTMWLTTAKPSLLVVIQVHILSSAVALLFCSWWIFFSVQGPDRQSHATVIQIFQKRFSVYDSTLRIRKYFVFMVMTKGDFIGVRQKNPSTHYSYIKFY